MTTDTEPSVAELVDKLQTLVVLAPTGINGVAAKQILAAADRLTRLERRCAEMEKALRTLVFQPLAPRDHLTSCDKIMGATHPCTCHADEYRALLLPPERANDGKIGG